MLRLVDERVRGEVTVLATHRSSASSSMRLALSENSTVAVMSASNSSCSLGAQCPKHIFRRHGLAGICLCQRTFERSIEPSAIFIAQLVIRLLVDALQERVSDLQPHCLVEREELLEKVFSRQRWRDPRCFASRRFVASRSWRSARRFAPSPSASRWHVEWSRELRDRPTTPWRCGEPTPHTPWWSCGHVRCSTNARRIP